MGGLSPSPIGDVRMIGIVGMLSEKGGSVKVATGAGEGRLPDGKAQPVRSLGSSASRRESPKRLNPKTAALIARPGKMAIQGARSANSTAAPRSMRPQAGVGSATPRPRKLKDASRRMAWPRKAVARIRYGALTFGSR